MIVTDVHLKSKMSSQLLTNVHEGVHLNFAKNSVYVSGNYEYYHYLCDKFDDRVVIICYIIK